MIASMLDRRFWAAVVLSSMISVSLGAEATRAATAPKIVRRLKQCVFRIETVGSKFLGSAFLINTNGILVTCAHVVEGKGDTLVARNFITLEFTAANKVVWTEQAIKYEVQHIVPELDLAILQAIEGTHIIDRFPYLILLDADSVLEGMAAGVCAFIPDTFSVPRAFLAEGIVSTKRDGIPWGDAGAPVDIIQLDLNISKGTSGGPIYSPSTGRVFAIMDAGIFESKASSQTSYAIAITLNKVVAVLDSLGIPYEMK